MEQILKHDSVHGRFKGEVALEGNNTLVVNGKKTRLTAIKDPSELKWNEVGADIVIESTGLFLTKETCEKHLAAGAKKVIMTKPMLVKLLFPTLLVQLTALRQSQKY